MSFFSKIRSHAPSWPPTSADVGKVAASVAAGIALIWCGKFLKFQILESQHKYNHYTNSYDIIKDAKDLKDKVCIVTGSNTGLGKETAKQLYRAGCVVVMACRNQQKAQNAKNDISNDDITNNGRLILIKLDLGDLKSIHEFVTNFNNNKLINGKLHYLINNAGVMAFPEFRKTTNEQIETQFGVNHIGHFYLTNQLLPVLKRNKTRIINLTSSGHRLCTVDMMKDMVNSNSNGPTEDIIPYDPWRYYGISKLCNVLFTRYLNKLYHSDGITAVCVHPGGIITELGRNVKLSPLVFLLFLNYPYFKSIPQGAATTLRCVTISDKEIYNNNMDDIANMNVYFDDCRAANQHLRKEFRCNKNNDLDESLWEYSKKIIQSFDYLSLKE